MSVLNDIRESIQLRLRTQSVAAMRAVDKAAKAIRYLHLHGCTVQQVTIRPDHVVIEIDQPGEWLKGSMHITRVNGRYREVVRVAPVLGCQVQWIEREAHVLLQREG
ncbi:hypothetical protein ACVCL0_09210 [Rhodanobacter sp. UC4450_H17]